MSDLREDAENVEVTDQENIIMNIFTLCDIEKTGLVPVSKLIEFISPYIDFNSAHLEELRKSLDPLQKDPHVTNKVFFKSMKEWTDKFKNEFQANCTPTEITDTNSKRLSDVDQRQSTPTKNFARGFFKGEYESGILNLSNISSYSYAGSTAGAFDPGILQEQINELQHQNRKLNEMLSDVRVQLNVSEEQNGSLQNDLERITKRLQAEQKVNDHLQKERKENDEYRENTNNIIKKYETLNQNLISYKKENSQLKNQIIDCENEIQKLQEAATKVRNNNVKKSQVIEELKIEIEIREKEITTLEECKRQLNQICKDKEDGIQQLIDETQHLKYEKITLEKRLSEAISRSVTSLQQENREIPGKRILSNIPVKQRNHYSSIPHSSTPLPITPNIDANKTRIFTFDSPMTRFMNNKGSLNSPNLIKMLANPISPIPAPTPTSNSTFRYSTSETVACKDNYSTGTDSSLEYLSPHLEGSKDSYQTSENVSVIENTVAGDNGNYIVYSLQSQQQKHNTSAEKECQISPSSCEKSTQTPPRKLHMSPFSSPQRILSKSINEQQLPPIKESRLSFSNPNIKFNLSASSPEPESNPTQRISKSVSPNVSSDDDYYWRSVVSTVQPYESLQSELMQVSTTGCVGACDHKMKQTQYEQEIESLQCELKQHENCQDAIEKYERELKASEERMEKYENDIKALQTELDEAKTQRSMEEKVLTDAQEKLGEFEEKFTNAQQEKEIEFAKLRENEEELRKEYDSKTKELANLKCEVKKFAEKVDNCKLELQRSTCDKAIYEEELKKAKELSEKYEEQCRVLNKTLEDMMKNIEAKDNEKEALMKDVEERDREQRELINSNRNLLEQMTMYKENYLLVQQEFSSLNEDYCIKTEELNEAKEQYVQLNNEFEKISSKYEEYEMKLKEMQEANEDDTICKKENLKLKADCETLTMELEVKTKRIETLENEYSAMKEMNKENEDKLHAFDTAMGIRLEKIHEEHALKLKEIVSYQENRMKQFDWLIVQKSGLEEALDAYEMKYKDATEKLLQAEELRTNYQDALAKLKERENQILKLEEDLEETLAQIDSLELAQEDAETKRIKVDTIMKEKIIALEKEMSAMQEKLTEAKAVSQDPVTTTTCTNCSNLDIERKSASTKPETRRSTRVELLHHKIEKLDEQLDEEKNRTKTLAENVTRVQSEKDDLEMKLAKIDDERKQLLLQNDTGQRRIKKLTHTVQGLELKLNRYKNTIEDISRQVEFRTKDMAQMELRFSDLQLKSNKISHTHSLLVTHMGAVRQKIVDQKKILGGNTLYAVNVWRNLLENVSPNSPVRKQDPISSESTAGPLDEEIHNLAQQINLTCILLKTLAKLRDQFQTPTEHGDGSRIHMQKSVETGNESLLSVVVKRKFVLRPASFILPTNQLNKSPMSPDSPAAEMADVPSPKEYASPRVELNNNDIQMDGVKLRSNDLTSNNEQRKSFASDLTDSGSTSDSGSSESLGIEVVAKRYIDTKERMSAGEVKIENAKEVQEGLARQFRSMSEGAVVTHQLTDDGDVTVFPNLRDNVLETLGLLPDGQAKERLSEDEIEVKFQTLTLAFAIDAVTLADRHDRQRRQRDQAEDNMATEVARLTYAIHRLNPLCIDAETTEMVTSLLSQLDVILQASNRISTSAEVFGSVQQEWRLAESVNVMLSHLRNLRQQRDTARRQLQCTKKMLQESTTTTEPTNLSNRQRISSTNGRVVTRRRASIATITRPLESPRGGTGSNGCAAGVLVDGTATRRMTTRRTSPALCEPSSRHWDSRVRQDWSPVDRPTTLLRSRPSRLELGVDLVKIKEGASESSTGESFETFDSDSVFRTPTAIPEDDIFQDEVVLAEPTTLRGHMERKLLQLGAQIEAFWNYIVEQGTIHEICCLGAIICFALSTIIIGNLLLEVQHARRGIPMQRIPLEWLTWEELIKLIFGDTLTSKGLY